MNYSNLYILFYKNLLISYLFVKCYCYATYMYYIKALLIIKLCIMLKNLSNLGTVLSKDEQAAILGQGTCPWACNEDGRCSPCPCADGC